MNSVEQEISQLEASWLPSEYEFSSALLSCRPKRKDAEGIQASRREIATQLLEELERSRLQFNDGASSGWLEERVDVNLFEEITTGPLAEPLDVTEFQEIITAPSSPSTSPISPFIVSNPASPHNNITKNEEGYFIVPSENEQVVNTFEDLFLQLQQQESAKNFSNTQAAEPVPPITLANEQPAELSFEDDDIAAFLLESLIDDGNWSVSEDVMDVCNLADCSSTCDQESIQELVAIAPGRRRSARAQAQPYQVPNKLEPAPSGAGVARIPAKQQQRSSRTILGSGRGRRAKLPVEDRKLRKKEQNKTAATRYRQKKKAETEQLMNIEQIEEDRHQELQKQHDELAHEVRYLKKLMREIGILA